MSHKLTYLQRRSELLSELRLFFLNRKFTEVETPLLCCEIIPEQNIEPVAVGSRNAKRTGRGEQRTAQWLQASPELHMKRLLAEGMTSIFQITRSFRADEAGALHNPEFTIVEWYRGGDDMQAGMALLDELLQTLLGTPSATLTSYGEAFQEHVGLCPHTATPMKLAERARALAVEIPGSMPSEDRDEWLNLILTTRIEPKLGVAAPEILYDYPASQAALAKNDRREDGVDVARRFELYWRGVELANGYDELTDAEELRNRLVQLNVNRVTTGRPALPLPASLLAVMENGLPESAGCALGFDRLVMLAVGAKSIAEVMAFPEA